MKESTVNALIVLFDKLVYKGYQTGGVPPAGSDSLSAPTGHRSFLQIPPPLRVSLDGRAAKRFPVSPDF